MRKSLVTAPSHEAVGTGARATSRLIVMLLAAASLDAASPAIWIIGDSTANSQNHRGWADPFAAHLDLSRGDFVLIQFGHNDGGPPDQDRARGSLPGIGGESKEITLPNGTRETIHTFGFYMLKFIAETKAKGATPVVLSPAVRNIWKDGRVERGPGNFSAWSREIAEAQGVPFLDVTNAIADRYEAMGELKVKELFPEDHTHTSPPGADQNASLVVAALGGWKGCPLLPYLSAKGHGVVAYPTLLIQDEARLWLPVPANPKLPTLFLIGDSTVRNGRGDGANGQWGWGEPIVDCLDAARINLVNRAVGGLSSRTYLAMGPWDRVLAMLKPGDFVILQFGHNDGGPLDDPAPARGTLPGVGEEIREIDNPITRKHEVVHTCGWYLRQFVAGARARGATPIGCSLIPRKIWKDGHIVRDSGCYAGWAAEVARAEGAGFLDLNDPIARRYDELGPGKVEPLFGEVLFGQGALR